jgi:hypothetical protein
MIDTTDSASIVVVADEIEAEEEHVEGIGEIQHTFDSSTICTS